MAVISGAKGPDQPIYISLPGGGELEILTKEQAERLPEGEKGPTSRIRVIDDRYTENPSFQIKSSHLIRDAKRKKEILNAIIAFNRATPTDPPWNRTALSLKREWDLHNLAYRLHLYRKSAAHVDLDNRDEGKGYLHFFVTAAERVVELLAAKLKRVFNKK